MLVTLGLVESEMQSGSAEPFALNGTSQVNRTETVTAHTCLAQYHLHVLGGGWEATINPESVNSLRSLRAVVTTIREARPLLEATSAFDELLTKAAARRGKPRDIEEWARQLADDTSDLND